jgi:hypothetical protein
MMHTAIMNRKTITGTKLIKNREYGKLQNSTTG